jgi:hypothetical protein
MAHILKEFAKHCGVKVGKPILKDSFYPILYKDYITIDTSNCQGDSQYLYFKEYVEAFKALRKEDIKVINISGDYKIENADDTIDQLTAKQCNYLIKNSKLHICVDSPTGHIASYYNIPTIVLFSHSHPKLSMPVWNTKNTECIIPDYKNGIPHYFPNQDNSVINTIYPDRLIESTNKLVNFLSVSKFKTIYIGKHFKEKIANVIPNFHAKSALLNGNVVNLRYDKFKDFENLQKWLQSNLCGIVTDEEIDLRILNIFKHKIKMIVFEFDSKINCSEEYLNTLKKIGIKFKIYIKNVSDLDYRMAKNDLFDFDIEKLDEPSEFPFKFNSSLKFASNNVWISEGKIFKSYSNAKKLDNSINIINDEDFIKEIENFYIYE